MERVKKLLPFLLLIVVASFAVLRLFPLAHIYGGLRLPLDAQAIEQRTRELLTSLEIDVKGLSPQAQLKYDDELFREVQQRYGVEKSNELVREGIPVHHWDVTWKKTSGIRFMSDDQGDASKQAEKIAEIIRGSIFVQLGTDGRLLEFDRKLPDTISLSSLTQPEAKALAESFVHRFAGGWWWLSDTAQPSSEKRIEQKKRVDYEFVWNIKTPAVKNPATVLVSVAGSTVVHYKVRSEVPEEYKRSDVELASRIAAPIIYSIAIVIMIVVAFKRFRSFELGFRLAMAIGILSACIEGIRIYLTVRTDLGWDFLIPLILGPLFFGGALVLVWAVSESVVRETWKEKLISFDLLSKGYAAHSRVGENVVRGIALGVGSLALSLLLTFTADKTTYLWMSYSGDSTFEGFGAAASWLYVLGHGLTGNAFEVPIFILFVLSLLRKRFSSAILVIGLGSFVMALTEQGHLSPLWLGMLIKMLVGAVSIWGFYRYDALTAFLSLFTFTVLEEAGALLVAGNPTYTTSGLIVIGVLVLLVIGGVASQLRKREITDFDEIMPAFARHITERQRLQQELEIARSVQMSFLPKANPRVAELDIASRCAPALEVGGDYYDFIALKNKQLGVVVGDVSGKGTQAAFFMTLTKGFVRALAEVSNSPSAVLTQVNKLFYENVERGVFISMVYGIFDMQRHSLTLARAGHNPVIMRKTQADQVQVVNPVGLALGLDAGDTFARSIQEVTIPFQSGDLFVFYTDGFPEAMNKTMEEFGEERLCRTIQKYAHGTAAEIMEGVFADMRQFVGKAKQHDDMTIVVVKVV